MRYKKLILKSIVGLMNVAFQVIKYLSISLWNRKSLKNRALLGKTSLQKCTLYFYFLVHLRESAQVSQDKEESKR